MFQTDDDQEFALEYHQDLMSLLKSSWQFEYDCGLDNDAIWNITVTLVQIMACRWFGTSHYLNQLTICHRNKLQYNLIEDTNIFIHKKSSAKWQPFCSGLTGLTPWGLVTKLNWFYIGLGNGLLPDGTKSLPEPMLTSHLLCYMAFIWEQFHCEFLAYHSVWWIWKLYFAYYCHTSQEPMS